MAKHAALRELVGTATLTIRALGNALKRVQDKHIEGIPWKVTRTIDNHGFAIWQVVNALDETSTTLERPRNAELVRGALMSMGYGSAEANYAISALRARIEIDGKPWGMTGIWVAFMATLKRAKLDRFRFHALRHFFVTALFRGGVSAPVVQKLAGHAALSTTRRCAQVHGTDRAEVIEALKASYKTPPALPARRRSSHRSATRRLATGRSGPLRS